MNIIIKITTDAKAAYKIAEKLGGSYFNEQGLVDIKRAVEEKDFFGAFDKDKMVGFIIYKEVNPEVVEITWMALDPDYQNHGIGTRLFEESIKEVGDYKLCEVKTLSEEEPYKPYEQTRAFYKKLGFIPLETIRPYPGWGEDNPCQIFIKPLK